MNATLLFTDGSVDTESKTGYGAYLAVEDPGSSLNDLLDNLKTRLKVKRFEHTSSTKLELQTLLWALEEVSQPTGKLIVYTDSQNIVGLPGRRKRLEQNNFRSRKNETLRNHELYREFYRQADSLSIEFVKVSGHRAANQKNDIDKIFSLVDRAARNALRENTVTNENKHA